MILFKPVLLATVIVISGCALTQAPGSMHNFRSSADSQVHNHYVMLQGEQTVLRSVANDEGNMILAFGMPVPAAIEFYDGDGRSLESVRSDNLVSLPGLHQGVLIKLGKAMSFVAVRQGARLDQGPQVAESAQLTTLRRKATAQGPAGKAMQRAIAAVGTNANSGAGNTTAPGAPGQAAPLTTDNLVSWRAQAPAGLPVSTVNANRGEGYITFVADSLQPVQAGEVVDSLRAVASRQDGVLLISGITAADAKPAAIELARRRADLLRSILLTEGISPEKLTVTAVFRTDTHVRLNPARPADTVGLTWLAANQTTEPPQKLSKK